MELIATSRKLLKKRKENSVDLQSETIKEIADAIAKAQFKMKNPKLDCVNPFYKSKYASLAAIRDEAIPHLSSEGVAVIQTLKTEGGMVYCTTRFVHRSGEWISGSFGVPVTKADAQGYGAASTYARRYLLQAMAGIVGDEDDDANAAVGEKPKKPEVSAPKAKAEKEVRDEKCITTEQAQRFYAIAKAVGWTDVTLKSWLLENYKIDSTKKIERTIYEHICEMVKEEAPAKKVDNG